MHTEFTKGEKRIIKKIASLQLESLRSILTGNCPQDVVMYCLVNEINLEELKKVARKDFQAFREVYEYPGYFLQMDKDKLSISRHLLANEFEDKKYMKSRRRLWRKILLAEQFTYGQLN